jgi:hypothetical protein
MNTLQLVYQILIVNAQVRHDRRGAVLMPDDIHDRICRIVGYADGFDVKVTHLKGLIRRDYMKQSLVNRPEGAVLPNGLYRFFRGVDGQSVASSHDSQPLDMIHVLMGNKYSACFLRLQAEGSETLPDPLPADACIYQNMAVV